MMGCTAALVSSLLPLPLLQNRRTDVYVLRSLMVVVEKLVRIHMEKPKFSSVLLAHTDSWGYSVFFSSIFSTTLSALGSNSSPEAKAELIQGVEYGLSIIEFIVRNTQEVDFSLFYAFSPKPILSAALDQTMEASILRPRAIDTLRTLARVESLYSPAAGRSGLTLASYAADALAFEVVLEISGSTAFSTLRSRLDSHPDLCRELAKGLYAALVSGLANSCRATSDPQAWDALLSLVREIDARIESVYMEEEEEEEKAQEVLEVLAVLLDAVPDDARVIELALSPVTLEGVATVAGALERYAPETWESVLLPWIDGRIQTFKLDGVSGAQLDQEIISLLRDGVRVFYTSSTSSTLPHASLGAAFFNVVVSSIRHGYIETERMPDLGALILLSHAEDGSTSWFAGALSDRVCHNRKTSNAVSSMGATLLGIEPLSVETDSSLTSTPASSLMVQGFLHAMVTTPTGAAYAALVHVLTTAPLLLASYPECESALLSTLLQDLGGMAKRAALHGADAERYARIRELVVELSRRVSPTYAPTCFHVGVATLRARPNVDESPEGFADVTLCPTLDRMDDSPHALAADDVDAAFELGGIQTRSSLAWRYPTRGLVDPHPSVRAAALSSLARPGCASVVFKNEGLVLGALDSSAGDAYDQRINSHEHELLTAAAPVLVTLAVGSSTALVPCLALLRRHIFVVSSGDACETKSTHYIDRVIRTASRAHLEALRTTSEGRKVLKALSKLSAPWSEFRKSPPSSSDAPPAYGELDNPDDIPSRVLTCIAHNQVEDAVVAYGTLPPDGSSRGELVEPLVDAILTTGHLPPPSMAPSMLEPTASFYSTTRARIQVVETNAPDLARHPSIDTATVMGNLNRAMVDAFLAEGPDVGPDRARLWMRQSHVFDPSLTLLIDTHTTR